MKRFIEKLMDRFGPDKPTAPKKPLWQTDAFQKAKLQAARNKAAKGPSNGQPVQEKPVARPGPSYTTTGNGRIIDGGPGKNVFARNKLIREETGTHETLKIVDEDLLEQIEEDGIDPYNTGRFDRSKSWDSSRYRK